SMLLEDISNNDSSLFVSDNNKSDDSELDNSELDYDENAIDTMDNYDENTIDINNKEMQMCE
ncbi:8214_t:CDS:1, partial [Racocetra persica]